MNEIQVKSPLDQATEDYWQAALAVKDAKRELLRTATEELGELARDMTLGEIARVLRRRRNRLQGR
jgi:hypothetical protein